ncbi:hypothetical protein E2562_037103 [Oryza meyeriana var. granulata]|uniref:Uncharacterized protein n=1 Tax=Oryza meyeriana var. granulata TaxID=110450 RepID=A0A6G1E7L8_9ORYZ|nr:hypothetical protein E2562_037103 [Oryza meyeriana var. granulata]
MGAGTTELTAARHQANVSGGSGCLPSSWPPPAGTGRRRGSAVVRSLQLVVRDVSPAAGWCGHRAWRRLLRRLAQETRCICSSTSAASRPITSDFTNSRNIASCKSKATWYTGTKDWAPYQKQSKVYATHKVPLPERRELPLGASCACGAQ